MDQKTEKSLPIRYATIPIGIISSIIIIYNLWDCVRVFGIEGEWSGISVLLGAFLFFLACCAACIVYTFFLFGLHALCRYLIKVNLVKDLGLALVYIAAVYLAGIIPFFFILRYFFCWK